MGPVTCQHTWTVSASDFRWKPTGSYVESPRFFVASASAVSEWSLKLYPKGDTSNNAGWISIFLTSHSDRKQTAKAEFWIPDWNGRKNHSAAIATDTFYKGVQSRAPARLCRYDDIDGPMGAPSHLKIRFVVTPVDGDPKASAPPALRGDLHDLLKSDVLADATLVAAGREFRVHRAVLAARSPVFRAMFRNDTKESVEGKVVIEDLTPEVVEAMLEFVYTDVAPNMETLAADLLAAADKYDLKGLKAACEDRLCSSISEETAVRVLRLADRHGAEGLWDRAVGFINANGVRVVETDGWKDMVREDPRPMDGLFRALLKELSARPLPPARAAGPNKKFRKT